MGRSVGLPLPFDAWATPHQVVALVDPSLVLVHEGLHVILEKVFGIRADMGNKMGELELSLAHQVASLRLNAVQYHEVVAVSGEMIYGDIQAIIPRYIVRSPSDPNYGPIAQLLRRIWNEHFPLNKYLPSLHLEPASEIPPDQIPTIQAYVWRVLNTESERATILKDINVLFASSIAQIERFRSQQAGKK